MKIKSVTCPRCGAPRVTPSDSAYLYCDYCGSYVDWDFYRAITAEASKAPGPRYEALLASLEKQLKKARKRGDKEEYRALQRRLHDSYVTDCPAACSPRINDPVYRAAYVEYMAEQATLIAFEPELKALEEAMAAATAGLQWKERSGGGRGRTLREDATLVEVIASMAAQVFVTSSSFWPFFEAFWTFTLRTLEKEMATGLVETYPDEVEPEQLSRTSASIFCEGWLPYLLEKDQNRLLEKTGLAGEYRDVPDVPLSRRHCGKCGGELYVPNGSRVMVCAACGHRVDTASPETDCRRCGAPVSVPLGVSAFPCPYCASEIRVVL